MKKLLAVLVLLLWPTLAFAQATPMETPTPLPYTITPEAPKLARSASVQLHLAGARPGIERSATWVSSNPAVAQVINSANPAMHGTLIAGEPGRTTIQATTPDGVIVTETVETEPEPKATTSP